MCSSDLTLNIMTLMALALMIGILVDDSIVVLENIHRHLELGESPIEAALNGRSEIGLAAIAITLADVIVYAPIAFVSGTVGQLFRQYGLTIVIATLLSLIISFTLTPMVASRWLKHEDPEAGRGVFAAFGRWWDREFGRLGDLVAQLVPLTVRVRWLVTAGTVAMLAGCGAMIWLGWIGTEYAPTEDDGNVRVNMQMPAGTSLAAKDDATRQLEEILQAMPEVRSIFTNVSGGGALGVMAASMVEPVARPSSTSRMTRPRTSAGGLSPRNTCARRSSSACSSATTRSTCSGRRPKVSLITRAPPSAIAPKASSGCQGTPSLRTSRTSMGTCKASATARATGTPPLGSASTVTFGWFA